MLAGGTRDGHSHGLSTHMPSRCHHGVTTPPCTPLRCFCVVAMSPNISTTPKVVSEVNIPSYAWSSHSSEGTAQASLDEDEGLEDDFQTLHTPVHHVVRWEDDGHRCSAKGRPEGQGKEQSTK